MSGVEKKQNEIVFRLDTGESVEFQHHRSLQKLETQVKKEWVSLLILGKPMPLMS